MSSAPKFAQAVHQGVRPRIPPTAAEIKLLLSAGWHAAWTERPCIEDFVEVLELYQNKYDFIYCSPWEAPMMGPQ
jgi:hypothetical protein